MIEPPVIVMVCSGGYHGLLQVLGHYNALLSRHGIGQPLCVGLSILKQL